MGAPTDRFSFRIRGRSLSSIRPRRHEWLMLVVGAALVVRYRWLIDDAFIYFRYVDNLVFLDLGLVYNAGEYVEGFSSPAWTLLLVPFRAARLDYYTIVLGVGLVSWLVVWASLVTLNRRLAPAGPIINLPLAYACAHYGLLTFLTSGLETPLVLLSALTFVFYAYRPDGRVTAILLGCAPMVRPELVVPLFVFVAWRTVASRRPPWLVIATATVVNLGWLGFRIYYYADFFPNTFYLKDEVQWVRGYYYLLDALRPYHLGALVVAGLLMLVVASRKGDPEDRPEWMPRLLLLVAAAASFVYPMRTGGDLVHFRHAAFGVVLTIGAFVGVAERFVALLSPPRPRLGFPAVSVLVSAVVFWFLPDQVRGHPAFGSLEMHPRPKYGEATWHRRHPDLAFQSGRWDEDRRLLAAYDRLKSREALQHRVRVFGWCSQAYRRFPDEYILHEWGLTEPILARVSVASQRPAHKPALLSLARDLEHALSHVRGVPRGSGTYRTVVKRNVARWIRYNVETIELIQQKAYNRHDFFENLRLARAHTQPVILPMNGLERRRLDRRLSQAIRRIPRRAVDPFVFDAKATGVARPE